MAITVVFDIPGMTQSQYDEVIRNLEAAGQGHPPGRQCHIAASKPDGWLVVDVWESPEKLDGFAQTLMPLLQRVGVTPPQPQVYPLHRLTQP